MRPWRIAVGGSGRMVLGVGCWVLGSARSDTQHPTPNTQYPTPNTASPVEAEGLTKHFGPRAAVDGVTFQVSPGEIFGLVGPDGAGKTTTMRLLLGLLPADGGSARVLGHDMRADPEAAR